MIYREISPKQRTMTLSQLYTSFGLLLSNRPQCTVKIEQLNLQADILAMKSVQSCSYRRDLSKDIYNIKRDHIQ